MDLSIVTTMYQSATYLEEFYSRITTRIDRIVPWAIYRRLNMRIVTRNLD